MLLDQFGTADPVTGYIPSYAVDLVNYNNAAPWPAQAAGNGPALIRVHAGRLRQRSLELDGQRRRSRKLSNVGGTPGEANISWILCRRPFPRAWPLTHR